MHPVFHISFLRPHLGAAPPLPSAPLLLYDVLAGEYEVKDLLDLCIGNFRPDYLAKWLGYPVFEFMWEPASHVTNIPDILH